MSNSFLTPRSAELQAFLSFTISLCLLKLTSRESVMPSNHLIFCCPLLLLPSIFPSIRVFSNELALQIRGGDSIGVSASASKDNQSSPSNEYSGFISFRIDWLDLLAVQGTLKSLLQHHSINSLALSLLYGPTLTSIHDYGKNHSFDCMDLYWQTLCFLILCLGLS